ncbi:MAG: hypothetical protein ACI4M6_07050, partial [Christensenellaceae bacterium]
KELGGSSSKEQITEKAGKKQKKGLFGIFKKKKSVEVEADEEDDEELEEDESVEDDDETEEIEEVAQTVEEEDENEDNEEEIDEAEEVAVTEEPEEHEETEATEEDKGISLKEALQAASQVDNSAPEKTVFNKSAITEWLKKEYGDGVESNNRDNYTSTGLPLCDTHYKVDENGKKCFMYAYESKDGKGLYVVSLNDEDAALVAEKHPGFVKSAFPKSKDKKWYSLIVDDTFESDEEVFDIIKKSHDNF